MCCGLVAKRLDIILYTVPKSLAITISLTTTSSHVQASSDRHRSLSPLTTDFLTTCAKKQIRVSSSTSKKNEKDQPRKRKVHTTNPNSQTSPLCLPCAPRQGSSSGRVGSFFQFLKRFQSEDFGTTVSGTTITLCSLSPSLSLQTCFELQWCQTSPRPLRLHARHGGS